MKNIIIVIIVLAMGWFAWQMLKPEQETDNVVTQRAGILKESREKAQSARDTANKTVVKSAIKMFHAREKTYPENLQELVEKGYLPNVPKGVFEYDPETGKLK